MMALNIIKSINNIKNLDNLFENKKSANYNINKINFNIINKKKIKTYFLKKNKNIFFSNLNVHDNSIYFNNLLLIINFFNISILPDMGTLIKYNNNINNNLYSNYNLSMIYNITLKEANKINYLNNSKLILNIRNEFRATNYKIFKKTSLIDLLLKKYLEKYLNTNISLNFEKYSINFFKKKSTYLRVIRRRIRRMKRLLNNSKLSVRSFIRVSLVFLYTKDSNIFIKILNKIMQSMHYKNHRKFLYHLKLFISKSMKFYFETLKFYGFYFYISGKISGGGNSKKKNYAIRCGKYSFTNKMLKLNYKNGLIYTKTGVLGYKLIISYN